MDFLPPASKTRLPFHPLVSGEPWKIISKTSCWKSALMYMYLNVYSLHMSLHNSYTVLQQQENFHFNVQSNNIVFYFTTCEILNPLDFNYTKQCYKDVVNVLNCSSWVNKRDCGHLAQHSASFACRYSNMWWLEGGEAACVCWFKYPSYLTYVLFNEVRVLFHLLAGPWPVVSDDNQQHGQAACWGGEEIGSPARE